jgi:glycosyltransferase involved in cell wall biosynthesis
MEFPELKLDGKETTLPVGSYARAVWRLRRLVRDLAPAFIYCSGGLPCQIAAPVARLQRIPLVCHFHHPAIKRDYYLWLVKFADKVIFPSQFTRKHSLQKAKIEGDVIYNGIDVERFKPPEQHEPSWRRQLGIAPDAIVIGQVAALTAHKRPDLLIRAFTRLIAATAQSLHLVLVGKGEEADALGALVRELRLEKRVSITGAVPDVLPYYQHVFDIKGLVSREEGLGIAVIEGAACGLPSVVTDCTGLAETVIPDKTGFRFGLHDVAALDGHLLRLVNDRELRQRMGAASREHVRQTFSADIYNARIVAATQEFIR